MIWLGVDCSERLWAVPETGSSNAYPGREPKALKAMHWLVPLRQAVAETCWPSASGPTVRILVAMPSAPVMAAVLSSAEMPLDGICQATAWPIKGRPLFNTSACTVQLNVAPAASESWGVREARTGGVPPANCACRLEPLVSAAVTMDNVPSAAVTFMVARPSPVEVTAQTGFPQASVAVPAVTV